MTPRDLRDLRSSFASIKLSTMFWDISGGNQVCSDVVHIGSVGFYGRSSRLKEDLVRFPPPSKL